MPTNVERRLGKVIQKAGHVCQGVRTDVSACGQRLTEVYDAIDAVVGGAHERATKTEIEAMMVSLDDAVTESEIAARDLAAATAKLREVRGRLDRAMQAFRAEKRETPMIPVAVETTPFDTAESRERQAGSEPQA